MGKVSATTVGGLLLLAMLLAPATSGHTQQTLTVILTDDGVVAGNITDPAFVQATLFGSGWKTAPTTPAWW